MTKAVKTAKGIKKNVIKKNIKHEDYKDMLFHVKQMHHTMKTISEAIIINLEAMSYIKVSLSCFDDKRYSLTRGRQKFIRLWSL